MDPIEPSDRINKLTIHRSNHLRQAVAGAAAGNRTGRGRRGTGHPGSCRRPRIDDGRSHRHSVPAGGQTFCRKMKCLTE